jgi:hypothetical protein
LGEGGERPVIIKKHYAEIIYGIYLKHAQYCHKKRPQEDYITQSMKRQASFLVGLLFNPEHEGDMFLQNVSGISTDYMALYSRNFFFQIFLL